MPNGAYLAIVTEAFASYLPIDDADKYLAAQRLFLTSLQLGDNRAPDSTVAANILEWLAVQIQSVAEQQYVEAAKLDLAIDAADRFMFRSRRPIA